MSDIVERLRDTHPNFDEKPMCEEAANEIERLCAENERLRKMVKNAYNDGFKEGMREVTSSRGGIPWSDCKYRAALSPAPSKGEPVQRDWREDQQHENGNFINRCSKCEEMFFGHKRRVICKACTSPIPSKGGDDE